MTPTKTRPPPAQGAQMTRSPLLIAAAEYAVAESAVLGFEGDRTSDEYEGLKVAWERATIQLGRCAREAGRAVLADLGASIAGAGRIPAKIGEAA